MLKSPITGARASLGLLAGLASAVLSTASAQQPSIYVDFSDIGFGPSGTPNTTFGAAPGIAGRWNDVNVNLAVNGTLLTAPLLATDNSNTSVQLRIDTNNVGLLGVDHNEPFTFGNDAALLDDGGFVGGPATHTFSGLPAGTYDVYTYAMAPDNAAYRTSVDVVGSNGAQTVGGSFASGYALGVTHAVHRVVVGATGEIVIHTDAAFNFDTVNGFQIFPVGVAPAIGTNYCTATPNSTGATGSISATGSFVAAQNALQLRATNLPANQFGIFLTSETQGFVPTAGGTSDGNLCLGGTIGRYDFLPAQILNTDATGTFRLTVNLAQTPQGSGFVSIAGGQTWHFQAWHRDSSPNGSNFTNGLRVQFQ